MAGIWTAEREADLKKRWADGMSAGRIASRLNSGLAPGTTKLTRNAVISKARRLGLPYRSKTTLSHRRSAKSLTTKGPREQQLQDTQRAKALAEFNAVMSAREEVSQARVTILARDSHGRLCANERLTERACRWPIGDPGREDFHFCGHDKVPGSSYCQVHLQRAYVPTPRMPSLPRIAPMPPCYGGVRPPEPMLDVDAEISDMGGQRPPSPLRVEEAPHTRH